MSVLAVKFSSGGAVRGEISCTASERWICPAAGQLLMQVRVIPGTVWDADIMHSRSDLLKES